MAWELVSIYTSPYIGSKDVDLVFDQFAGGGTTLVETELLNCDIIGIDINDVALDRCKEKTAFEHYGANGKYIFARIMREI